MGSLTLTDILTANVDCSDPDTKLKTVFQTLTANNNSCCVVAGKNRIPLGVITHRDLIRIVSKSDNYTRMMDEPVSDHMRTPPFTMPGFTKVEEAINCIEDRNLHHTLVTAVDGSIIGIVTQTDMVQAYARIIRNQSVVVEQSVIKRTKELENVNRKLVTLSLVDPLTGLGNRRAMEVDIMKLHASGIRHRRAYSIVLFDIDFFKKYNDHYGHQAGDKALQQVASLLRKGIRDSDAIYRYGGEEFLMTLPDTDIKSVNKVVERMIRALFDVEISHIESPFGRVTVSAGVACSHHFGQRLANWRQVVEFADEGLYNAKNSGRNQLAVSQRSTLKVV